VSLGCREPLCAEEQEGAAAEEEVVVAEAAEVVFCLSWFPLLLMNL
jgi:hypothetical protein